MAGFQTAAVAQGAMYEEQCRWLLEDAGWDVLSDRPFHVDAAGVEIDLCAVRHGQRVWFECKGSWRGDRPGLRRTDTTKKAILTGYLLRSAGIDVPYVVLTTHMPIVGSSGAVMLDLALRDRAVTAVACTNDPGWSAQLDKAV